MVIDDNDYTVLIPKSRLAELEYESRLLNKWVEMVEADATTDWSLFNEAREELLLEDLENERISREEG